MKLDGVSALSSLQQKPIAQPQASPQPSENEPEVTGTEDGGGKAKGVISKLNEGDHFKGVAAVRLLISHFDNPDLEKIDPNQLPDPQDVPGKAYEKFLEQYRSLYNASQVTTEPEEPVAETPPPDTEPVVNEEPVVIEEPVAEVPPVTEEQPVLEIPVVPDEPPAAEEPVTEVPAPDTLLVAAPEFEPVTPSEQTPVDDGTGVLTVFKELLDAQTLEEQPETLDIIL